jgi:cellulose synthase operon protein B
VTRRSSRLGWRGRAAFGSALGLGLLSAVFYAAAPSPSLGQTAPPPNVGPTAAPPIATPAPPPIWRMPGAAASMRMEGEDGSVAWPVYVPAASLSRLNRFQLVFQAAISVMPEASWLTLAINGKTMGRVPIAAPTAAKTMAFDVPPGALSPGWNEVQVSVVQRHRVDCSIAATYELWTQIDPARTGFVGASPTIASLADLPAKPVDPTGVPRIRLTLPPNPGPADIERGLDLAERVALQGRFLHPVIDLSSAPASLQIALGPTPDLDESAAQVIAPGLRLAPGAGKIPTLAPSVGANDFDTMFGRFSEAQAGSPEGLRAFANASGARIRPGDSVALAELGLATHAFTGRLFRAGFDLVLPPDAYLADYGEAALSFDGGYAADLTSEARLVVRVNGIVDGSLALDRVGGAALQGQVIHMPLGAFRPGRNHLEIEAQLPTHADQTCDTLAAIEGKERFLILGESTLTIPKLARIARFPGLSATFTNGFRVTREAAVKLYLPRPTPSSIAAAGTLLANVAVHSGAPIGASVLRSPPTDDGGAVVVVGAAADLPAGMLGKVGVDASSLANAWAPGKRGDVTGAIAAPTRAGQSGSDLQRLDAWGENTRDTDRWFSSTIDWAKRVSTRSLRAAGLLDFPDPPYSVTPDTSFVVGQGMYGATPMTLFAAPDEATLEAGANAITDSLQLAKMDGRAAALDSAGTGLDLVPARDPLLFRTAAFNLGNERLIAAGWLSNHAGWYIAAAMLAAILLGVSTWATLAFSRRQA